MRFEMKISLQNYEEYFVRYLDEELTAPEQMELHSFLKQYPHLRAELETFRLTILPDENEFSFGGKERLLKGITESNCQDYFIRKVEGLLSPSEEKDLGEFIQFHPQYARHLRAFEATKLTADTRLVFPDKNSLKRREGRVVALSARVILLTAVAASLLLVFFFNGLDWLTPSAPSTIAEQTPATAGETAADHNSAPPLPSRDSLSTAVPSTLSGDTERASAAEKNEPMVTQKSRPLLAQKNAPATDQPPPAADPSFYNESQMQALNTGSPQPIYYLPKQRKALYKELPENLTAQSTTNARQFTKGSLAANLGEELLRLSGRGDYLPAEARAGNEDKQPLALNIEAERFGLNTTLFKKRADKTSNNP
jgi:hypothetical protein